MKEKELKLEIEELEERIAPSFAFPVDHPANANGAGQGGPQAIFASSFGPDSSTFPSQANLAAWNAHNNSPVLENGGNN